MTKSSHFKHPLISRHLIKGEINFMSAPTHHNRIKIFVNNIIVTKSIINEFPNIQL